MTDVTYINDTNQLTRVFSLFHSTGDLSRTTTTPSYAEQHFRLLFYPHFFMPQMFLPRIVTNQVSSIAGICITCGTRVCQGWSWAPSFYSTAYCYSCLFLAPVPPSVCRMSPCCTALQLCLWVLLEFHLMCQAGDQTCIPLSFPHSICRALQFLMTSFSILLSGPKVSEEEEKLMQMKLILKKIRNC